MTNLLYKQLFVALGVHHVHAFDIKTQEREAVFDFNNIIMHNLPLALHVPLQTEAIHSMSKS